MATERPRTAFISGPLEVSNAYFTRYYTPRIDAAIAAGEHFVVGPVSGIDALALSYLLDHSETSPSRVRVHMAGFEVSARPAFVAELKRQGIEVVEAADATTTWDRDAAMTRASDYDILRYRTEWEQKAIFHERWRPRVSNTERNERRRRRFGTAAAHDATSEEDLQVKYIRHVGGVLDRSLQSWARRWSPRNASDEPEQCDGACDGHRDVVYWSLIAGNAVFGLGNDGMRKT